MITEKRRSSFQLATINDFDIFNGLVILAGGVHLSSLADVHTLKDLAKDDVFSVQPLSVDVANEKLRTVSVRASVSHGEAAGEVLELEVLVVELVAIDGFTAGTVEICEVTTLHHEILNDTVEDGAFVAKTFLTSAQGPKVLNSLWNILSK